MNQDRVKELLLQIEDTDIDFSVTFTGKESRKVNGLYKPDTHEILLHNKNFANDNELLYTAIHEYTHHKRCEQEGGFLTPRAHSSKFWSLFHKYLAVAEQKGFYKVTLEQSPELLELTDEIRNVIMAEDGRLMKELGRLLIQARPLCKKAGVRYEDYIDRVLCLPRTSAEAMEKFHAYDIESSIGYEAMKTVAKIGNPANRAEAEKLFLANNSPALVQDMLKKEEPVKPLDPIRKLEREKSRIERAIENLQIKLDDINRRLENTSVQVFILCAALFLLSPIKGQAQNSIDISVPEMPSIPSVANPALPPQLPTIKFPQFFNMRNYTPPVFPSKKPDTKTLMLMKAEQNLPSMLGNLTQEQFFNANGLNALNKILHELEKLKSPEDEIQEPIKKQEIKEKPLSLIGNEKKAELLRFRLNGKDVKSEFTYTLCSQLADDKSFFFSADRPSRTGKETETIYFLCRLSEQSRYEIFADLRQEHIDSESALYKLIKIQPLICESAGNIVFCRKKTPLLEVEIIFEIKSVYSQHKKE